MRSYLFVYSKMNDKPNYVSFSFSINTAGLAPLPHDQYPVMLIWTTFTGVKQLAAVPVLVQPGQVQSQEMFVGVAEDLKIPLREKARRDDAIWFELYTVEQTLDGANQVFNRSGSAYIYYSDFATLFGNKKLPLSVFSYWTPDGERFIKAEMTLTPIGTYEAFPDTEPDAVQFAPDTSSYIDASAENAILSSMEYFTEDGAARGVGLSPVDAKNKLVHAPAWNRPDGWLPGYAYFISPSALRYPAKMPRSYLTSMRKPLQNVLARHARTTTWFIKTINDQLAQSDDTYNDDFTLCCAIIGEALCAPSTSLPYIGDSVNSARRARSGAGGFVDKEITHSVESFDWAIYRGGGDCEDLARLIASFYWAYRDAPWPSSLLRAVKSVLELYTGLGVLTSVLGAQLSDADARSSEVPIVLGSERDLNVKIGAHMYYQLVPNTKFAAWVRRVQPDHDIDAIVGEQLSKAPAWRVKMPHLVLEGTGMLQPLQQPAAYYPTTLANKQRWATRQRMVAAAENYFGVMATAEWAGRKLSLLTLAQTVRQQAKQTRVPNARVGTFYRDATHFFTDDVLRRGFDVCEFLVTSLGKPQRVPDSADPEYRDDPMLSRTSAQQLLEDTERRLKILSQSESTSSAAAPARILPHWQRPQRSAERMLNMAAEESTAPSDVDKRRADRFPYGPRADSEYDSARYGVPLTDQLQDRPMLNHVSVAAGPPLTKQTANLLGLHFRQGKPVPFAGETKMSEKIYAALGESMAAAGYDRASKLKTEQEGLKVLEEYFKGAFGGSRSWNSSELHSGEDLAPINLFINVNMLSSPDVVKFIISCLDNALDAIRMARVRTEQYFPGQANVVLQFALYRKKIKSF